MSQFGHLIRFTMRHKLKYLITLVAALVFMVWLFPFKDVGDLVSSQVAQRTNNQIFLQMDRLNLGLFPPSIGADNISVETPMLPSISAQELTVIPSLSAIITQKTTGQMIAKGLFRGEVEVEVKPGKRTEAGVQTHLLSIKAQSLSLAEINKVAELPVMLKGKMNLATAGTIDPTFVDQPDLDIEMNVDQLEIPPSAVNTPMGPLNLPDLKLSSVQLKGRLSAGRLNIERGIIGRAGDEISGTIKGGISITMSNSNGQIRPLPGAYDLTLDLNIKKSFQDKASSILSIFEKYQSPLPDGIRFQMRVNATSTQIPPNMDVVR